MPRATLPLLLFLLALLLWDADTPTPQRAHRPAATRSPARWPAEVRRAVDGHHQRASAEDGAELPQERDEQPATDLRCYYVGDLVARGFAIDEIAGWVERAYSGVAVTPRVDVLVIQEASERQVEQILTRWRLATSHFMKRVYAVGDIVTWLEEVEFVSPLRGEKPLGIGDLIEVTLATVEGEAMIREEGDDLIVLAEPAVQRKVDWFLRSLQRELRDEQAEELSVRLAE